MLLAHGSQPQQRGLALARLLLAPSQAEPVALQRGAQRVEGRREARHSQQPRRCALALGRLLRERAVVERRHVQVRQGERRIVREAEGRVARTRDRGGAAARARLRRPAIEGVARDEEGEAVVERGRPPGRQQQLGGGLWSRHVGVVAVGLGVVRATGRLGARRL